MTMTRKEGRKKRISDDKNDTCFKMRSSNTLISSVNWILFSWLLFFCKIKFFFWSIFFQLLLPFSLVCFVVTKILLFHSSLSLLLLPCPFLCPLLQVKCYIRFFFLVHSGRKEKNVCVFTFKKFPPFLCKKSIYFLQTDFPLFICIFYFYIMIRKWMSCGYKSNTVFHFRYFSYNSDFPLPLFPAAGRSVVQL